MQRLISVLLCLSFSIMGEVVEGDFFEEITYKGEVYKKCRVTKLTPAYMEIMHSFGGENFYIHLLEKNFREKEFPKYDIKQAISYEQGEIARRQSQLEAQVKILAVRREEIKRQKALMNKKLYSFQLKTYINKEFYTEQGMFRFKRTVTGVFLEMARPKFYQNNGKKVFDYSYSITISNGALAYSKSFSGTEKSIRGGRICAVNDDGHMKLFRDVLHHADTKITVSGKANFTRGGKDKYGRTSSKNSGVINNHNTVVDFGVAKMK